MNDRKSTSSIGLEAQQIKARLEKMEVGEIVTYEELEALCGRDRNSIRNGFYTAARILQREAGMTFGCIFNAGYKRLNSIEKIDTAVNRRQHIHRTARTAGTVLSSVNDKDLGKEDLLRYHKQVAMHGLLAMVTTQRADRALDNRLTAMGVDAALPTRDVLTLFIREFSKTEEPHNHTETKTTNGQPTPNHNTETQP